MKNNFDLPIYLDRLKVNNFMNLDEAEYDLSGFMVLYKSEEVGKSVIFSVLEFLSDCFNTGLRNAWNNRKRSNGINFPGSVEGPITIEIRYKESGFPISEYHLSIIDEGEGPIVLEEWIDTYIRGKSYRILEFSRGKGKVLHLISEIKPTHPDAIAASILGQFEEHARISALRSFISNFLILYSPESIIDNITFINENIINIMERMIEYHPEVLEEVFSVLRRMVPRFEKAIISNDKVPILQIKDTSFPEAIPYRFSSDGTLKLLSYLLVAYDPTPPSLICIDSPEKFIHPRLFLEILDEFRKTASRTQVIIHTNPPVQLLYQ